MTTITPPPPPTPPPSVPRALPTVTVANPTAALLALSKGAAFEGTVVTEGGSSTVQISTVLGTLQIQTTLPLSAGTKLDLTLQNLSPQVQLQIATIDGKPALLAARAAGTPAQTSGPLGTASNLLATGPGATAAGPTGAAIQTPAGALPSPQSLIGISTTGILLRPEGSPANAAATMLATPASTTGTGPQGAPSPFMPIQAGALRTPGAAVPGPNPAAPSSGPLQSGAIPTAASGPAAVLTQGMKIPLRIAAVLTPEGGTSPPPAARMPFLGVPAPGQSFVATATGTTTQGQPILRSPLGPVALTTTTPLPRGATVTLQVAGPPVPPETETSAAPPAPRPLALFRAHEWHSFRDAYQAMQDLNPSATQHLVANLLPRPDTHLAANILFFLSALRGGDVSTWLGDPMTRLLQRNHPALAGRLRDDFQQMAGMAREPAAGDWRIALIPFVNGPELEQLRLYMKPYGGEEEDDEANRKGIRFIIDVDLTRLGRMQLDGLVRDDKKRVDLIVRSQEPLPAAMQADIRTIFEEANELTGKSGGLSFQAAPPDFIEVSPKGGPDENPDLIA